MSRGINEFAEYLAATIAADSALKAWCQAAFRKNHEVMVGVDPASYPKLEDVAPVVMLNHGSRGVLEDVEMQTGSIRASCAISHNGKFEFDKTSGIWKSTGPQLLDDFTNIVMKLVVNSVKSDGYYFQSISSGPDDVIAAPLYQSFFGIEIQFDSDF